MSDDHAGSVIPEDCSGENRPDWSVGMTGGAFLFAMGTLFG